MSHEHSYQHDLDNVIDASGAVLAIGTEKVDTNTLKDKSLTGNDATIHGAMHSIGYFLGRRFTATNENYLDCGNDSSFYNSDIVLDILIRCNDVELTYILSKKDSWRLQTYLHKIYFYIHGPDTAKHGDITIDDDKLHYIRAIYDRTSLRIYVDGIEDGTGTSASTAIDTGIYDVLVGSNNKISDFFNGVQIFNIISHNNPMSASNVFNTLARLPLYSHNFTQYPNSDTSLTTIFPYTSGIITSGSFNKTNVLKCTSAGTIIFSNNFEFDGSEYITLTIDGVEYSGTTTVTQGTITATIAQGSNDITIEMGTNDVLEDIQIQFRSEV